MSAKSRKIKKIDLAPPTQRAPRVREDIEYEYGRLVTQAGQTQYQIAVYEQELERLNDSLKDLNYEAAARQKLDAEAAAVPKEEPNVTESEQS